MENNARRRTLIVDPDLQWRIVLRTSMAPALILVLAGTTAGVLGDAFFASAGDAARGGPTLVFWAFVGFLLAAAGVVLLRAVQFSHSIAGPATNLARSLRRIREGDLNFRVRLREGDELTGLAQEVNKLIGWLEERERTTEKREQSPVAARALAAETPVA